MLSFAASLLALAALHGALTWWGPSYVSLALALALFGVIYALCARFILREEFDYVVRAFTRRRPAT
jgi:xanthine/uracil permease